MTKSHKILVLVPPVLIGLTVLLIFFFAQHRANEAKDSTQPDQQLSTTTDYVVDTQLPSNPDSSRSNMPQPGSRTDNPDDFVACTMDAKQCPDGSFVGRQGPDCAFAACPNAGGNASFTACELSQREVDFCIELYAPVCGQKQVQCVTEPCDPIPTTFSNSCFACMDAQVTGYTEGACTITS